MIGEQFEKRFNKSNIISIIFEDVDYNQISLKEYVDPFDSKEINKKSLVRDS